jgi:threonine-phosphate decarboxylase
LALLEITEAAMNSGYQHGGGVERAAREAGIPVDGILDFSANINPMGLPVRAAERLAREAQDPKAWSHYPDPEARELRSAISHYAAVQPESIVIGAGADSLIHAAVGALAPRRCLIPVPAFSEYERASEAYGCEAYRCESIATLLQLARCGDLIVFNNPHNPTGACADRAEMLDRIAAARACGATILADEAFIDYDPNAAITKDAAIQEGVIAVRSLTKFFGCPGLRVGYAVAAANTARKLAAQLPPWPVTTLASNALVEALRDAGYREEALESNCRARASLSTALSSIGCRVFPSAANFLLLRLPAGFHATDVRARLLREHSILARECDSFGGLEPGRYLRVAVRHENENARLIEGLAGAFRATPCLQTHS